MKSIVTTLVAALALPAVCFAQFFKGPDLSARTDFALLSKQIHKHSPLLRELQSVSAADVNITPEEARALVNAKLNELNNPQLNQLYAKLGEEDGAGKTRIGVVLHILMNHVSIPQFLYFESSQSKLGGGFGVYVMRTLAHFILMPELAFMFRPFSFHYFGNEYSEKYSYLTLAFTAMYIIKMKSLNLLLGLSPNFGYALGGKAKVDEGDWEDAEFGGDGVKRTHFGLGIAAGIMLKNAMVIRLVADMPLSTLSKDPELTMFGYMLSLYVPIWKK